MFTSKAVAVMFRTYGVVLLKLLLHFHVAGAVVYN